ncbi:MAG: hypothetical protein B6U94_05965 [Thermofilum sp. ex4484_79]|nr:MAG: hypothetical protein B6U94_05965 [Thermofilum sp. ex4484_79]
MKLFSKQLILKEFKDLVRDPRIWIPFIISIVLLPAMGLVISAPMKSAVEQAVKATLKLAVVNLDEGSEAEKLIGFLNEKGTEYRIKLLELEISKPESSEIYSREFIKSIINDALRRNSNVEVIIIFPSNFTESLRAKVPVKIVSITIVKEISFIGTSVKAERIMDLIDDYLREKILEGTDIKPVVVVNPLNKVEASYIYGKRMILVGNSHAILTSLALGSFLIPIILMMITVTIMQMTAISMAVENEEKTLETLLTLPLTKTQILLSKLIGSFIVAAIGSAFSIVGFVLYIYMLTQPAFMGAPQISAQAIISPLDMTYIIASMIATTFFTAAIGIIIGALSSDTRIAGTMVGPLSMLVFIPGMMLAFTNISNLGPIVYLLYIIPLTQPVILIKQAVSGMLPYETFLYIIASIVTTILVIVVTAKIFSLETLSNLQYKLSKLRRK